MIQKLRVAIQMDPMEGVNIAGDSSFALAMEAEARGFELFHYLVGDLTYDHGKLTTRAHPMSVRYEDGNHFTFGEELTLDLRDDLDVILMRQDPPFDMAYITATHLLEMLEGDTLVVNDPKWVRNAPEKLFVMEFPDLMPKTMITRRLDDIQAFRAEQGEIILKPLYGNGGEGIFHIKEGDSNIGSLHEMFMAASPEPIMVQEFLPAVRLGDKRIILVDGKAVGAINRVPAKGEVRSNLVAGGRAEDTELTPREEETCARIGPALKDMGQIFVGIDVIDGWLTEINVTSPTGIMAVNAFQGVKLEAMIWDAIEARLD